MVQFMRDHQYKLDKSKSNMKCQMHFQPVKYSSCDQSILILISSLISPLTLLRHTTYRMAIIKLTVTIFAAGELFWAVSELISDLTRLVENREFTLSKKNRKFCNNDMLHYEFSRFFGKKTG